MYSVNSQNPFGGLPMNTADMMEFGQRRFNPIMGLMSPANIPYATSGSETTEMLRRATNNLDVRAATTNQAALNIAPRYNSISVPNKEDSDLLVAISKCESVKTDNCEAFNDPEFAQKCVISHEPGKNSKGEPHLGGFVLFKNDRDRAIAAANGRFPTFRAAVGSLPVASSTHPQRVSYDKASCETTKKRINCEEKKLYSEDCGVCNNGSGTHQYLGGVRLSGPSLYIAGKGKFTLMTDNGSKKAEGDLQGTQATEIPLPEDVEGKTYSLIVEKGNNTSAIVSGYLQGQTVSGFNRSDIAFLTTRDKETGSTPSKYGSMDVVQSGALGSSTERMTVIRSRADKNQLNIDIYIPYTFTEASEPVNFYCTNAPFSRKVDSAKMIGTDPCYKMTSDGKLSKDCLIDRWASVGCTSKGKLYPGKDGDDNYNMLIAKGDIDQITEYMYDLARKDKIGRNPDGSSFSTNPSENIKAWDTFSQQCSGTRRANPCDQYDTTKGPLGRDCLTFLYNDEGRGMGIGGTYTAGYPGTSNDIPDYASLKQKTIMTNAYPGQYVDQQCTPSGTMNPAISDEAFRTAQRLGGVAAVKQFYSDIHAKANSTEKLSDTDRGVYMDQCYGIKLSPDTRNQ